MRISSSSIPVAAIASDKPAQPQTTAPQPGGGDARADVVQLSAAGTAAASRASWPTSSTRIATLKASIEDGSYHVDLDKLANRIVEEDKT
jgi:flagellar biosynthesis anti-sigma factor FlgM